MWLKSSFTTPAVAAISFCLIGGTSPAVADILHVPGDFPTIQAGIDAAVNGDEVVVADGIYTGDGNRDIDFNGKLITVRSANGPDTCIIDCQGTFNDANRGFYFHSGETAEAQVQGFTITNGRVAFPGGGGMYILNSSPTVADCVFADNLVGSDGSDVYGGAMYNQNSSPSVTNCAFIKNTVYGGGFEDGDIGWGGGMANLNSNPIVRDCSFIMNKANAEGDTAYASGGGMYNSSKSNPLVIGCTFIENSAWGWGGGMYNSSSNPTVTNCAFSRNNAGHGTGGMTNIYSSPMVTNCTFIGNEGWESGMGNGFSSPTVTNCTFINRSGDGWAMANGSGSALVTNCIFWDGSFLINDPFGTTTVSYSDVHGGWFGAGSNNIDADPMFIDGASGNWTHDAEYDDQAFQTTFTDTNASFAPNQLVGKFVDAAIGRCCFDSLPIAANTSTTITVWTNFAWGVVAGHAYQIHDYRLASGSPCIDAGDNTAVPEGIDTDLDGNDRFVDDLCTDDTGKGKPPIVDMGAYEFQVPCPWDLDCNGSVGASDLLSLLVSWGPCKGCPADFDGDGTVGASDLLALLVNWGPCP
ncbi:MAG: right-handed parallel beta-helix repeat-containing protein [Phycisphaerales bacterium]